MDCCGLRPLLVRTALSDEPVGAYRALERRESARVGADFVQHSEWTAPNDCSLRWKAKQALRARRRRGAHVRRCAWLQDAPYCRLDMRRCFCLPPALKRALRCESAKATRNAVTSCCACMRASRRQQARGHHLDLARLNLSVRYAGLDRDPGGLRVRPFRRIPFQLTRGRDGRINDPSAAFGATHSALPACAIAQSSPLCRNRKRAKGVERFPYSKAT